MATATATSTATVFTLELDEREALYLWAALLYSDPAEGWFGEEQDDPVWDAVDKALEGAGCSFPLVGDALDLTHRKGGSA